MIYRVDYPFKWDSKLYGFPEHEGKICVASECASSAAEAAQMAATLGGRVQVVVPAYQWWYDPLYNGTRNSSPRADRVEHADECARARRIAQEQGFEYSGE